VDAERDALSYRGYVAHELAEKASYEEVAYLLLHGKLPAAIDLKSFGDELIKERGVSEKILAHLRLLPKTGNMMIALQLAMSLDYLVDPDGDKIDPASNLAKAKRLIAKTPYMVTAIHRLRDGKVPIPPNPALGHAANFLYMLTGNAPDPEFAKIFNSSMILYAEHGYNASTFAALVTASTLSDMHSAIVSAIGTLKGPLHGGANEAAIEMMLKIGDASKAEAWIKQALEKKDKIMGFGHRVYKHQDSRAPLIKILAEKVARRVGDTKLFPLSCKIEEIMRREKNLFPNVDFHCAVAYYLMGLPIETYTPIFAMARMAGWTAHLMEQYASNRLIRPECFYTGDRGLTYVPIESRTNSSNSAHA
jgi:citrate synthase